MKINFKSALLIATALGFTALPAMAQQGNGGGDIQQMQQKFEDRKADILQHMKDRQACVEAANDYKSLGACMLVGGRGNGGGRGDDQGGNDSGGSEGSDQ